MFEKVHLKFWELSWRYSGRCLKIQTASHFTSGRIVENHGRVSARPFRRGANAKSTANLFLSDV